MRFLNFLILGMLLTLGLQACGGGGGGNNTTSNNNVPVVTPAAAATVIYKTMTTPRYMSTQTVLNDGRVLITGGSNGQLSGSLPSTALTSAEIFDPVSGTFTATGNMTVPRVHHKAVKLSNGKVLIVGGYYSTFHLKSAEIYDPQTGVFTSTGSLTEIARDDSAPVLLQDGRVLMVGGRDGGYALKTADIYDPTTGVWTRAAGQMSVERTQHAINVLNNGKVLIVGGCSQNATLRSCELFDPSSQTFTLVGNLSGVTRDMEAAASQISLQLPNGNILITTNQGSNIYDPVSGLISSTSLQFGQNLLDSDTILLGYYETYSLSTGKGRMLFDGNDVGLSKIVPFEAGITVLPGKKILTTGGINLNQDPNGFMGAVNTAAVITVN